MTILICSPTSAAAPSVSGKCSCSAASTGCCTTRRKNGTVQVTYNGHPLYYYSADKVGKVMCQHVNMHGGLWLIMKPNGQPNMAMGHGM